MHASLQSIQPLKPGSKAVTPGPKTLVILYLLLASPAFAGYRFDTVGSYLADASALPAWAHTLDRHSSDKTLLKDCLATKETCTGRLKGLRHVIQKGAQFDREDQLRLVNRYINKRRYRRDRSKLSLSAAEGGEARLRNQWSTLLEFLKRGGDCEDYATAKYFLLRELGFPAEDMRIVISFDRSVRAHHAVLAIRQPDESSWLLETDNRILKSRQPGYRFIYAINEFGIWDHEE